VERGTNSITGIINIVIDLIPIIDDHCGSEDDLKL
jgi:hypothetical protein